MAEVQVEGRPWISTTDAALIVDCSLAGVVVVVVVLGKREGTGTGEWASG